MNGKLDLLLDAWLVGIWAHENIFTINQLIPRARLAAAKTVMLVWASGLMADFADIVTIFPKSSLDNTRSGLTLREELFATTLLYSNDVPDVGLVVLSLD